MRELREVRLDRRVQVVEERRNGRLRLGLGRAVRRIEMLHDAVVDMTRIRHAVHRRIRARAEPEVHEVVKRRAE